MPVYSKGKHYSKNIRYLKNKRSSKNIRLLKEQTFTQKTPDVGHARDGLISYGVYSKGKRYSKTSVYSKNKPKDQIIDSD